MLQHGEGMCELRAQRERGSLRGLCSNFLIEQSRGTARGAGAGTPGSTQGPRHWALLSFLFIAPPPANFTDFERTLRNDFGIWLVTL